MSIKRSARRGGEDALRCARRTRSRRGRRHRPATSTSGPATRTSTPSGACSPGPRLLFQKCFFPAVESNDYQKNVCFPRAFLITDAPKAWGGAGRSAAGEALEEALGESGEERARELEAEAEPAVAASDSVPRFVLYFCSCGPKCTYIHLCTSSYISAAGGPKRTYI